MAHWDEGERQLIVHNRRVFFEQCAKLKGEFRLSAEKATRSAEQNAFLWVLNTIVANDLGWEPEEVHDFTKSKIHLKHKSRVDLKTGEIIDESFPGDTHDLPKDAFSEYIEKFVRYWAEEGIILPDSEEQVRATR